MKRKYLTPSIMVTAVSSQLPLAMSMEVHEDSKDVVNSSSEVLSRRKNVWEDDVDEEEEEF